MKNIKLTGTILVILILVSCGKPPTVETNTTYYKKQEVTNEILEVSIEASGIIDFIYQLKLNLKHRVKCLYLGAEVGDFIKKALY